MIASVMDLVSMCQVRLFVAVFYRPLKEERSAGGSLKELKELMLRVTIVENFLPEA